MDDARYRTLSASVQFPQFSSVRTLGTLRPATVSSVPYWRGKEKRREKESLPVRMKLTTQLSDEREAPGLGRFASLRSSSDNFGSTRSNVNTPLPLPLFIRKSVLRAPTVSPRLFADGKFYAAYGTAERDEVTLSLLPQKRLTLYSINEIRESKKILFSIPTTLFHLEASVNRAWFLFFPLRQRWILCPIISITRFSLAISALPSPVGTASQATINK